MTDRITPLPWKSWKTEMFNKHKTRGLDEWASGYNVGLDNGLQEAVEIYEQSAKLEALNAELVEALQEAADELYTTSRATVFDGMIQKENASACERAFNKAKAALEKAKGVING
jgi:hypothetical protein